VLRKTNESESNAGSRADLHFFGLCERVLRTPKKENEGGRKKEVKLGLEPQGLEPNSDRFAPELYTLGREGQPCSLPGPQFTLAGGQVQKLLEL
jgi:hypothetical protein